MTTVIWSFKTDDNSLISLRGPYGSCESHSFLVSVRNPGKNDSMACKISEDGKIEIKSNYLYTEYAVYLMEEIMNHITASVVSVS